MVGPPPWITLRREPLRYHRAYDVAATIGSVGFSIPNRLDQRAVRQTLYLAARAPSAR